MDLKITPNEVYVTEHGALIRTRCPKDNITNKMIHERVLAANLSAGDIVRVQCFNHSRTTVLYFCEYLVYDRSSELKRIEVNDQVTRQVEDTKFSVMRLTDWRPTPVHPEHPSNAPELVWNLGKKMHQVKINDEVVYESPDKDEALEHMKDVTNTKRSAVQKYFSGLVGAN